MPFPWRGNHLLDDFNRGALGSNWGSDDASGQFIVEEDELKSINYQASTSIYWHATEQGATQEVSAKFVTWHPKLWGMQLFLKSPAQSLSSFSIMIYYTASLYGEPWLAIAYKDSDWHDIAGAHRLLAPGSVLGGRSFPDGCVELFIGPELILSGNVLLPQVDPVTPPMQAPDASFYDGTSPSYVGLGQEVDASNNPVDMPAVWDDFSADSY